MSSWKNGSHVCMMGSGVYFSFWAWPSEHLNQSEGWVSWEVSWVSQKCCVVISSATNKVLRNWTVSANLDLCLHLQVSMIPFRVKALPPSWSFKWSVRPCPVITLPCLTQAYSSIYAAALGSFWGYMWPQGSISIELAGRWMAQRKVREESNLVGNV